MSVDIGAKGSSVGISAISYRSARYGGITYERIKRESAVQTNRALASLREVEELQKALRVECAKIIPVSSLNREIVEQGTGLSASAH